MLGKTADIFIEAYRCGKCYAVLSTNWDNTTVTCLNSNCEMALINLEITPIKAKIKDNGKDSNTSKTINR